MPVLGKRGICHRKRHFHPDRVLFHLSFSCLVPVCADSKSYMSTCLCWERKAFFIKQDIFIKKESFISLVCFLPSTYVFWFKSHMSTCLHWERKAFFIEQDIFTQKESFTLLVIFLQSTCECWQKDIFTYTRVSIHFSFSYLVPVCADAKSRISTCLCWERRAFVIEKDIFTRVSIYFFYLWVLTKRHFHLHKSFNTLLIFLPSTSVCCCKITY